MKLLYIFLINLCLTRAYAQFTEKSISFGIGPVYDLPPNSLNEIKKLGPSLCLDFNIGKTVINKFGIQVQYSYFQANSDIYSFENSSNSFPKIYDFQGYYSLFSLGGIWQRNFRIEHKNQLFIELGGSIMWHKGNFSFNIIYKDSQPAQEIPRYIYRYPSFNLNFSGGMRQKLNDKLSLFEKTQLNYNVIENAGNGNWLFNPVNDKFDDFLYIHLYIGLTYKF